VKSPQSSSSAAVVVDVAVVVEVGVVFIVNTVVGATDELAGGGFKANNFPPLPGAADALVVECG
jgi:hypothetical protein